MLGNYRLFFSVVPFYKEEALTLKMQVLIEILYAISPDYALLFFFVAFLVFHLLSLAEFFLFFYLLLEALGELLQIYHFFDISVCFGMRLANLLFDIFLFFIKVIALNPESLNGGLKLICLCVFRLKLIFQRFNLGFNSLYFFIRNGSRLHLFLYYIALSRCIGDNLFRIFFEFLSYGIFFH